MLSKGDKWGYGLSGACVILIALVAIAKGHFDRAPKPGSDNCVGVATRNTVVLLDHSESVSEQTREEIVARTMRHILEHVEINERVSIFTVSELSKRRLKPLVALCRPPAEGSRVTESLALIKRRFQANFEKPVREALMSPIPGSKESPIAQAVTDVSLSQYLRGEANSLLVFSDMLEHTPRFSLYNCHQPAQAVQRYREAVKGTKERPTFRNTAVSIHFIPRTDLSRDVLKCRDVF